MVKMRDGLSTVCIRVHPGFRREGAQGPEAPGHGAMMNSKGEAAFFNINLFCLVL